MAPESVALAEYGVSRPVQLGVRDLQLLDGLSPDRLEANPTTAPGWFTLRASSWVGTVNLDSLRVRIAPKVDDLENVLMMFASVAGLAGWSPRLSDYAQADLVEGIAELVLRVIDQATRRGLIHGYQTREDRLAVLRGRLLVAELVARPWEIWPTPCRHDEFTADVPENRVLLAAVKVIRGWSLPPEVRRLGTDLATRFEEVSDSQVPLLEVALVRESPLNEHYRPALALAAILLEGAGLAHTAGTEHGSSFLIDMNSLYERWIGAELVARLWPEVLVAEQESVPLSRHPTVWMKPDLLFRTAGRPVLVGDVKYKLTGSGIGRTPDYYQLLAYATALELTQGVLVYCQADGAPPRSLTVIGGGQNLVCYPLGLAGSWSEVGQRLDDLAHEVKRLSFT